MEKPSSTGGWFLVSRRAKQITSQDDFGAYRKAGLLPKAQLHPLIASKVYPAFMRGEYDTAVFQAFREVEVSVRAGGNFGHNDYGTGADARRLQARRKEGSGGNARPAHGYAASGCRTRSHGQLRGCNRPL